MSEIKNNNPTTLQLSQYASKQLSLISYFTNKNKSTIIENFILDLMHSFYGEIGKSVKSGAFIDFNYDIKAFERADMVSGTYPIAWETPTSDSDKITWSIVEAAFNRLDQTKLQNKIKFKKALLELSQH
jgi:hypothetical protein